MTRKATSSMNVDKGSPEGQLLQSCCNTLNKIVAVRHAMMFGRIHDRQSVLEVLAKFEVNDVQVLANMATEEAEQLLKHLKNAGIEPPAYDWRDGRAAALRTMAQGCKDVHGAGGGSAGQESAP